MQCPLYYSTSTLFTWNRLPYYLIFYKVVLVEVQQEQTEKFTGNNLSFKAKSLKKCIFTYNLLWRIIKHIIVQIIFCRKFDCILNTYTITKENRWCSVYEEIGNYHEIRCALSLVFRIIRKYPNTILKKQFWVGLWMQVTFVI